MWQQLQTPSWHRLLEHRALLWVCYCFKLRIFNSTNLGGNENYMQTPGSQRQGPDGTLEGGLRMSSKLGHLPKPKNDFELVLPDDEADEDTADASMVSYISLCLPKQFNFRNGSRMRKKLKNVVQKSNNVGTKNNAVCALKHFNANSHCRPN